MSIANVPTDAIQRKHFRLVNQTVNDYMTRLREPLRNHLLQKIMEEIDASGPCTGTMLDAVVADALEVSSLESAIFAVSAGMGSHKNAP